MKTENLGAEINDLCRAAGQKIGIEFSAPPPLGVQIAGRWELGYQPKGLSWRASFTYWLGPNSYLKESVMWPFKLQTKQQDSAAFSQDVSAKLTQMQQWIRAM